MQPTVHYVSATSCSLLPALKSTDVFNSVLLVPRGTHFRICPSLRSKIQLYTYSNRAVLTDLIPCSVLMRGRVMFNHFFGGNSAPIGTVLKRHPLRPY